MRIVNPPAIIRSIDDLALLAKKINAEHAKAGACLRQSLAHARAAGDLLIRAKARLPHGQWLDWLEANCTVAERTARAYMQVASGWADLASKSAAVADLNFHDALDLLAVPQEEDDAVAARRTAEIMTGKRTPAEVLEGLTPEEQHEILEKTRELYAHKERVRDEATRTPEEQDETHLTMARKHLTLAKEHLEQLATDNGRTKAVQCIVAALGCRLFSEP